MSRAVGFVPSLWNHYCPLSSIKYRLLLLVLSTLWPVEQVPCAYGSVLSNVYVKSHTLQRMALYLVFARIRSSSIFNVQEKVFSLVVCGLILIAIIAKNITYCPCYYISVIFRIPFCHTMKIPLKWTFSSWFPALLLSVLSLFIAGRKN